MTGGFDTLDGEQTVLTTTAHTGAYADGAAGQITCTTDRVVFVSADGTRTDIDTDLISSVEYTPPNVLWGTLLFGIVAASAGLLAVIHGFPFFDNTTINSVAYVSGVIGIPLGLVCIFSAFYYRFHSITIHTGQQSYTFSSKKSEFSELQDAVQKE